MRILLIVAVIVFMIAGCPARKVNQQTGQPGTSPSVVSGPTEMVMIFSATEGDQWSRDLLSAVGDQLGFDPWASADESGHLDIFGPYTGTRDEQEITVNIVFTGLSNVVGLESQWSIAEQTLGWLEGLEYQLAWIDGDQAQLQVGQLLIETTPILFTGIVLDCALYYQQGDAYTGLYKRHSMSAVFTEIWNIDTDAQQFALVTDNSFTSAVRVKRFVDIQDLLPDGYLFHIPETVYDWGQLQDVLAGLDESVDAVIVTGMGIEGSTTELMNDPCPAEILAGLEIPVVTLGPTQMDEAGVTAVSIDPAVHARLGVDHAIDILNGTDPRVYVPLVPEDMSLFRSEGHSAKPPDSGAEESSGAAADTDLPES